MFRIFSLISMTSSIPTCEGWESRCADLFHVLLVRQQAPAGTTHLPTTPSYKAAACTPAERFGRHDFYLSYVGFQSLGANPGSSYTLRTGKQRLPGKGAVVASSGLRASVVVGALLPCGIGSLFERHFSLLVTWADFSLLLVTPLTFLSFIRLSPFFRCCFSK